MPRTKSEEKMILLSFHLPKKMLEDLNELVRSGAFPSRSEAIRVAIRDLINREKGGEKGDYSNQLMEGR